MEKLIIPRIQRKKISAVSKYVINLGGLIQALIYFVSGAKFIYSKVVVSDKINAFSLLLLFSGTFLAVYSIFFAFKERANKLAGNVDTAFAHIGAGDETGKRIAFALVIVLFPLTTLLAILFMTFVMLDTDPLNSRKNLRYELTIPSIVTPAVRVDEHQK